MGAGSAARPLEKWMEEDRKKRRESFRKSAIPIVRNRLLKKFSPAEIMPGRNREGKWVRTFLLDSLKINGRNPTDVRILFNREKKNFEEGEKVPRKQQVQSYDIFGAVRVFSTHIPASYAKEVKIIDKNLQILEQINARLVQLVKSEIDPKALREMRDELEWMAYTMSASASAYRDLATRHLTGANMLLEKAEEGGPSRARLISNACAKLTAVRNRESWRDRQRERTLAYEYFRECSIRIRRDRHVQKALANAADDLTGPEAREHAKELLAQHMLGKHLMVLKEIVEIEGEWRTFAILSISDIAKTCRDDDKAFLRRAFRAAGKASKKYFLLELRAKIRPMMVNNPALIADELEESHEGYLDPSIKAIRDGFLCLNSGKSDEAAEHFRRASVLLH